MKTSKHLLDLQGGKRLTTWSAALGLMLVIAQAQAAPATGLKDLLQGIAAPTNIQWPEHAKAGRRQAVQLDRLALRKPSLALDLLGEKIAATRDRSDNSGGHYSWIGHVDGDSSSEIIVTEHGNAVSGTIRRGGKLYELSGTKEGQQILFEVDESKLPPDGHEEAPHTNQQPAPGVEQNLAPNTTEAATTSSTPTTTEPGIAAATSGTVHDLMVVYTPASCNRYGRDANGGCSTLESKIVNAVAAANQAYLNSQIAIQLNLVHMAEISYTETGDMTKSLYDLTYVGSSYAAMDQVQSWRDSHGADLVQLVTEDSNYCGIAWLLGSNSASYAYSVSYSNCLSSQTLAHEIGHNQGDSHDRANSSSAYYPYAYGYRNCVTNGIRTIMAYPCNYNGNGASTIRISNFSNPNVFYNGAPTGIDYAVDPANSADNARTMNATAATIAAYRASTNTTTTTTTAPATPTGLTAVATSYAKVDLNWSDNSSDESGFKIERSLDGSTWSQITTTAANAVSYSDTTVNSSTVYYYRLRAYNSAGNSAYSNVVTVTTPVKPSTVNDYAIGETRTAGTLTNTYTATQGDDGVLESLKEVLNSTGNYSYLQHRWTFNVTGGSRVTLFANAYMAATSSDGDAFNIAYSTDGVTYTNLFTITSTNSTSVQWATLPASTKGTVYIRVRDSNRTSGHTTLDTLRVDQLYIQSQP